MKNRYQIIRVGSAVIALSLLTTSCTSTGGSAIQTSQITGALAGAGAGALIGAARYGNPLVGAVLGGIAGFGAGTLVGKIIDQANGAERRKAARRAEEYKGHSEIIAINVTKGRAVLYNTKKKKVVEDATGNVVAPPEGIKQGQRFQAGSYTTEYL